MDAKIERYEEKKAKSGRHYEEISEEVKTFCIETKEKHDQLLRTLVENGTIERLNAELRPYSFLARSDPSDVARVESRTFICSEREEDAGPTNHWVDPDEMRLTLAEKFDGAMRGRTMYVVPFSMGPLGSPEALELVRTVHDNVLHKQELEREKRHRQGTHQQCIDAATHRCKPTTNLPLQRASCIAQQKPQHRLALP